MISREVLNRLSASIDAEIMRLEPKIATNCGKPGWKYRDLPPMSLPLFQDLLTIIGGRDQIFFLTEVKKTWPDGGKTIRGQVLFSPEALEKLKTHTEAAAQPVPPAATTAGAIQ